MVVEPFATVGAHRVHRILNPTGDDMIKRRRIVLALTGMTMIAATLATAGGPGAAQALPRTCAQVHRDYAQDIDLMQYYRGQWNSTGQSTFYDSYMFWQGKADQDSAEFATAC
jgi:hypothetical protein